VVPQFTGQSATPGQLPIWAARVSVRAPATL
jgi:hypothetical protein